MSKGTTTAKRAAIYCRISSDKTGAGLGVERQETDCRELADRLGWTVEVVRTDNDISAYGGKKRPGYLALLEDIKAGRVDGVLVWHTDRLHRSPVELEAYIRACESGNGRAAVETQTVKAGLLDLATPTGRMVARTLGNIAHFEVEHMIERQKSAKKQMRTDGRWQGSTRPYGYRPDGDGGLVVVEEEAAEIRAAAARVLAGDTLYAIAKDMNARGARTPREATRGGDHEWAPGGVRKVLRRAVNAGLVEHQGQVVGLGRWEPILDEATWRGVTAIFADPARQSGPGPKPRFLLTGVLRCGVCGGTRFRVSSTNLKRTKRLMYACHTGAPEFGWGCVARDVERLDEWAEWLIFERLSRPGAAKAFKPDVDLVELEARRAGLRARLDELGAAFGRGDVDLQQVTAASKPLGEQLDKVDREISGALRGSALDGIGIAHDRKQVEAKWAGLPLARRRAVAKALMEIVVHPTRSRTKPDGYRFGGPHKLDPDALKVVWKTP